MKIIKRFSRYFLLTLLVFFTLTPLNILAETNNEAELSYVALGNSLAAGILNDLTQGIGYPAHIKDGIERETAYSVILDNEGVGGYTTVDVVEQLSENKDNVIEKLTNADLITIDIGANDLLGAIDMGAILVDPDSANDLLYEAEQKALPVVAENFNSILEQIRELNPEASVYVMGYYNGLYFLPDFIEETITTIMGNLNKTIATASENYQAYYVPTLETFDGKYEDYLPNPDIHPTEEGYVAIAGAFLDQILPNLPTIEEPDLDIEAPVITLLGDNPLVIEVGDDYEEPGATAEDNVDGDLTDQIEIHKNLNTGKPGEYEVVYSVTDAAGNEAQAVRLVKVVEVEVTDDENKGVITMEKSSPEEGGRLPDTATNIPLFILVGNVLFFSGGMIFIAGRRRYKVSI